MSTSLPLSLAISQEFYLTPQQIKACEKYYILYWQSRYLYSLLLRGPRIVREKVPYTPIFQDGLTFEELGANPELEIRCSFRKLPQHTSGNVILRRTNRGNKA